MSVLRNLRIGTRGASGFGLVQITPTSVGIDAANGTIRDAA
ncbi:hypothetical protein SAMN05444165_2435 [Paraburkholderia phenazinium]|uniref:Uncharacterized protein n=1 Tax=Paraburkholderia phenazinium TaxID=60549 RepID=A0A1N6IS92_9BURK|nr:hypothetical protein SAMN05444165_2435 [Paraburkholderia phenazinium]